MINVASGKQQGSQMVMNKHIILQHKYKQYLESSANLNKATVLLAQMRIINWAIYYW